MFIHDIAVFSEKNDPTLFVEVKTIYKCDPDWASNLGKFILSKTENKGMGAFLLATPPKWFFFKDINSQPDVIDSKRISDKYFPEYLKEKFRVSHEFYEKIVWDVLEDLLMSKASPPGFESLCSYLKTATSVRMESQAVL